MSPLAAGEIKNVRTRRKVHLTEDLLNLGFRIGFPTKHDLGDDGIEILALPPSRLGLHGAQHSGGLDPSPIGENERAPHDKVDEPAGADAS